MNIKTDEDNSVNITQANYTLIFLYKKRRLRSNLNTVFNYSITFSISGLGLLTKILHLRDFLKILTHLVIYNMKSPEHLERLLNAIQTRDSYRAEQLLK